MKVSMRWYKHLQQVLILPGKVVEHPLAVQAVHGSITQTLVSGL